MKYWTWTKNGEKCNRTPKSEKEQIKDEVHEEFMQKFTRTNYVSTDDTKESTLFKQTLSNPFMKDNNYVDDLMTECQYLRPQNSNYNGNNK